MRHLASAQYWDQLAGGNTGRLFLTFGGPVCADRISICPLDRVLTYKNLIYLLYPSKAGILWITHGHRPRPQRFSCVQPTSHISFGIYFKLFKWLTMVEIWPPYCFGRPGVKIRLWGVQNVKKFDYCLCSSCSAQLLSDLFYI